MKNTLFVLASLLAVSLAFAGTRARDSNGAPPLLPTDGVSLADSQGCRLSVRSTDGGTVNGGSLRRWYYDAVNGWVPEIAATDCALGALRGADGGAAFGQACPAFEPLFQAGRVAVAAASVVTFDAGAVPGLTTRVECWGPNIP